MPEELEFRSGAYYCPQCRQVFPYRTHVVVGSEEDEVFKCPECNEILNEVKSEKFMDNSEEILHVMQQLEDELREN